MRQRLNFFKSFFCIAPAQCIEIFFLAFQANIYLLMEHVILPLASMVGSWDFLGWKYFQPISYLRNLHIYFQSHIHQCLYSERQAEAWRPILFNEDHIRYFHVGKVIIHAGIWAGVSCHLFSFNKKVPWNFKSLDCQKLQ